MLILLAMDRGFAARVPMEKLAAFQQALRRQVPPQHEELIEKIEKSEDLEEAEWNTLAEAVEAVTKEFSAEEPEQENPQSEIPNPKRNADGEPPSDRKTDSDD